LSGTAFEYVELVAEFAVVVLLDPISEVSALAGAVSTVDEEA
jgi:hypothetical protein